MKENSAEGSALKELAEKEYEQNIDLSRDQALVLNCRYTSNGFIECCNFRFSDVAYIKNELTGLYDFDPSKITKETYDKFNACGHNSVYDGEFMTSVKTWGEKECFMI